MTMKAHLTGLLLLAATLCCLTSCLTMIYVKAPRWLVYLKHNGVEDSYTCFQDTYPVSQEYSVPEFFIMDDGKVVFRFYYKDTGFKLQFANDGAFSYGRKYTYKAGDEFFDVSFDWLYKGKSYECNSGFIQFERDILDAAFTVNFEFDLTASDGSKMEIRKGQFTAYDKVKPRNISLGLK